MCTYGEMGFRIISITVNLLVLTYFSFPSFNYRCIFDISMTITINVVKGYLIGYHSSLICQS